MNDYVLRTLCFLGTIGFCLAFIDHKYQGVINHKFMLSLVMFGLIGLFLISVDLVIEFFDWICRLIKG